MQIALPDTGWWRFYEKYPGRSLAELITQQNAVIVTGGVIVTAIRCHVIVKVIRVQAIW